MSIFVPIPIQCRRFQHSLFFSMLKAQSLQDLTTSKNISICNFYANVLQNQPSSCLKLSTLLRRTHQKSLLVVNVSKQHALLSSQLALQKCVQHVIAVLCFWRVVFQRVVFKARVAQQHGFGSFPLETHLGVLCRTRSWRVLGFPSYMTVF